jgi:hypothetical protein
VPATHYHPIDLNWLPEKKRWRGDNLVIARPIDEPTETFEDIRKFAGHVFGISNIDIVSAPPWDYSLPLLGER